MNSEIQYFINLLGPYIHTFGYLVAFFGMMLENAGIPVPAETALIVLAFFAGQGSLKIWLLIPIAIIGDITGDSLGYVIGRFGGRPLIKKFGRYIRIDKKRMNAAESLFKKRGGITVFTSQFFSVTRTTISLFAGVSKMAYKRFLAFDAAAATILVLAVSGATYYFGKNLDAVLRFFHTFRLASLIIVIAIITIYFYRYYHKKPDKA